jgi:hypothetical protein
VRSQSRKSVFSTLHAAIAGLPLLLLGLLISGWTATPAQSAAPSPTTAKATTVATRRTNDASTEAVTATGIATATPTATVTATIDPASLIYSQRVAVLFPGVIRFVIVVQVPIEQVESAQVMLTQGSFSQNADVKLIFKDTLLKVSDQSAGIDYRWLLTDLEQLKLFQNVTYKWQITLKSGQVIPATGKFMYQDDVNPLKNTIVGKISLYAPPALPANFILPAVSIAQTLIAHNTGIDQSHTIAFYPIGLQFCAPDPTNAGQFMVFDAYDRLSFPCDPSNATKVYAANGIILLRSGAQSTSAITDELITLLANDAYDSLWQTTGTQAIASPPALTKTPISGTLVSTSSTVAPAWFREGLALLYAPNGRTDVLDLVREASRTDTLFTLDELSAAQNFTGKAAVSDTLLWNSQSYLLTLYLTSRYGADVPFTLAKQIASLRSFPDALTAATNGTQLSDLYAAWQDWLFSPAADAALSFSPYPTQATATAPPTLTTLPTFTPSNTATGTATPSATPGS